MQDVKRVVRLPCADASNRLNPQRARVLGDARKRSNELARASARRDRRWGASAKTRASALGQSVQPSTGTRRAEEPEHPEKGVLGRVPHARKRL